MSWEHLNTKHVKSARKEHNDDAIDLLLRDCSIKELESELTDSEREEFQRRRANGFEIEKGEPYMRVVGKWEGDFCSVAYSHFAHALCVRFDAFED